MAPVSHSVTLALCAELDDLWLFAVLNAQHLYKCIACRRGLFSTIFMAQRLVAFILRVSTLQQSVIKATCCFCTLFFVNVSFALGGGRLVKDYCISLQC